MCVHGDMCTYTVLMLYLCEMVAMPAAGVVKIWFTTIVCGVANGHRVYREYTELRYMVSIMGLWMLACSGSCVAMVAIA